jgi:GxxExxY protein
MIELMKLGLDVKRQLAVKVFYDGKEVGNYFADLIVDDVVIIELKAGEGLVEEHEAQLTNYLRATKIEVGLLLNFGSKAQVKRKVFSNQYKTF